MLLVIAWLSIALEVWDVCLLCVCLRLYLMNVLLRVLCPGGDICEGSPTLPPPPPPEPRPKVHGESQRNSERMWDGIPPRSYNSGGGGGGGLCMQHARVYLLEIMEYCYSKAGNSNSQVHCLRDTFKITCRPSAAEISHCGILWTLNPAAFRTRASKFCDHHGTEGI